MKILDLRVNWMYGWGNDPRIELLVDGLPDDLVYQHYEPLGVWFAERHGFVSYFSWIGPDNEEGFGGAEFTIQAYLGEPVHRILDYNQITTTQVILKGPWSSRAGVMNGIGLWPQCTEVSLTDDPKVWKRGDTFLSGNCTIGLLEPELVKRGLLIKKIIERKRGSFAEVRYKLEKPPQCEVRDLVEGQQMHLGRDQDYRCRLPLGHQGEHKYDGR